MVIFTRKTFFIFLLACLFFFFYCYFSISLPQKTLTSSKEIEIVRGESIWQIANELELKGVIKNKYLFLFYLFLTGKLDKVKAGVYLIPPFASIKEIAQILIKGKEKLIKLTIPEGWNLRDIGLYLEKLGLFQAEEFWKVAGFPAVDYNLSKNLPFPYDFSKEFPFLKEKPKNIGLEGYLYPDTYFIPKNISPQNLIRLFLTNFNRKVYLPLQKELKHKNKTLFEIIIMASLVEKEVKTKEEKELVAGILWKRLKTGMPLQVDATITYITGKKTIKITYNDLEIDSPYNTYKYKGLPIGPICNPGLESILATLYPQKSPFWYYLTTPEGNTIFSKTYQEHLLAKQKYLK